MPESDQEDGASAARNASGGSRPRAGRVPVRDDDRGKRQCRNPNFLLLMTSHGDTALSSRTKTFRNPSDHPGTPSRQSSPLGVARLTLNKPRTQPDRTWADGVVVAYLCNFLDKNEEKPWKVLKAASLTPKTDADWHP